MGAADYSKLLTIERPINSTNATGETVTTWQAVAALHASLMPLTSRDLVRAASACIEMTHRIRMRYTREISGDCRLRYDSPTGIRYFNIVGNPINVGEANRELEMQASEIS